VVHIRTVKTASGASAVQIVYSNRGGKRRIEHIGSAHDDVQLELLKTVARQRMLAGQGEFDLGLDTPPEAGGPLPVTASRMGHLWDALTAAYQHLGFDAVTENDQVFHGLVLARIIEPTSKLDSLRVLHEVGVAAASYRTVRRRLPVFATDAWRTSLASACAAQVELGPTSLVLYDVSTLYFETDQGDGFREPGFSKERRLEPQITIGLLTDASGFPLRVEAFEGNAAETTTMLPTIQAFMAAHRLTDVTVVADAGMVSDGNKRALEAAGLSFILGARIPDLPWIVQDWKARNPGVEFADGQVWVQPWPAGPTDNRRDHTIYYQYRADRARRTLRGILEQVTKAQKAVDGQVAVKRNRFVKLTGATKSINQDLVDKTKSLAGLKAYVTNLPKPTAEQVISAYHQLWHVEKAFRMSKHDLQARPIYHHQRESIDAHLSIVMAALAVAKWIETATGWSIRKFVKTARRYRTFTIKAGEHTITAADPVPADLAVALDAIKQRSSGH
jgi:Transposase DDE domain